MTLVPLTALGRQSGLQGSQHSPSDPRPSLALWPLPQPTAGQFQGFPDLVPLTSCFVCPAGTLSRTHPPYAASCACPDLPSQACPTAGTPSKPCQARPTEQPGALGRCWPVLPPTGLQALGKKHFLTLTGGTVGRPNPELPGCAPRGPQRGLAQGPSLLRDLDKPTPSVPHPNWVGRGVSRSSALRLQGVFSPLGRMSKCRCPAQRGGSGLAGLGRAQESAF